MEEDNSLGRLTRISCCYSVTSVTSALIPMREMRDSHWDYPSDCPWNCPFLLSLFFFQFVKFEQFVSFVLLLSWWCWES